MYGETVQEFLEAFGAMENETSKALVIHVIWQIRVLILHSATESSVESPLRR